MNILTKTIRIFSTALAGIALAVNFGIGTALAANVPAFNSQAGDKEFLRGQNLSAGATDYSDPLSATAGNEVRGIIYYHNVASQSDGQPGATAKNTRVKLILPQEQGATHLINGELWADNAAKVDGTYIDGVEVGQHGLTINAPASTNIEFIAGSVQWFPNSSSSAVNLPFGQSGNEIISANGLNLGDIQGCWQFAGYVTFKVKIKGQEGQVNIVRTKEAFNETQNLSATTVKAKAGDVIRYSLITKNTGNIAGTTNITDDLTDILEYARVTDLGGGAMSGNTINFGSVQIAAGGSLTKTFKVQVKDPLPLSGDFKMTNIYGNTLNVEIYPPEIGGEPILKIEKQVRNKTENTGFNSGIIANPGDSVEYKITITNYHGRFPAKLLKIKDLMDSGMTYIEGSGRLEIAGQTRAFPKAIFNADGYLVTDPNPSLGPVGQNNSLTIYFEAKINSNAKDDSIIYNKACTSAESFLEVCDQTKTLVQLPIEEVIPKPEPKPQPPTVITMPAPPVLPKTGPAETAALCFGLTSSVVTATHYLRSRKHLLMAALNKKVL